MSEWLVALLVVLVPAAISGGVAVWNNRHQGKEAEAGAADRLTGSALKMVDEFQQIAREARDEVNALKGKLREVEEEQRAQAMAIENLTALNYKLQLLIRVFEGQLRSVGIEPLVDPDEVQSMTIDELRLIVGGLENAERRRKERYG